MQELSKNDKNCHTFFAVFRPYFFILECNVGLVIFRKIAVFETFDRKTRQV